jgi:glycine/D-amino acid oxidase-like deaminating enzyme
MLRAEARKREDIESVRSFPAYQSRSGWNALLPQRQPRIALPASRAFASVVIGAGYTGLAAARRLAELEPGQEVLVIDSSSIGEGSAGRNSGFLSTLPNQPLANRHGSIDEAAARQVRLYTAGLNWLRSLVQTNGINCDWDETSPRITAAATPAGERRARATLERNRRWGIEAEEFDQRALASLLGTDYYRYGYSPKGNAFVQPAALIRGLADTLPSGVHLLENTPVLSIDGSGPFIVTTSRGDFTADRVLVATNVHARALGLLRDRMVAICTYGGLTPELPPSALDRLGTASQWGVIPAHPIGTTLRKVGNRFLVRSGDSYETEHSTPQVQSMLSKLYRRRYPAMASHDFEYVWGGVTAITRNGGLYFGQVRPGLYASAGCNGSGVVRGTIHGKLLAEMACASQSSLLSDRLALEGPNWIPPEPIRRIGVRSRILMEQLVAGRER